MNYLKITLSIIIATILMSGCTNGWDELNVNPNAADINNISPKLLLPAILQDIASKSEVDANNHYPLLIGHLANSEGWAPTGDWAVIQTYKLSTSFHQGYFNSMYRTPLKDIKTILEYSPTDTVTYTYYKAAALVLQTWCYQQLVDRWGDVPYSEALNTSVLTPKYDDAKTIYLSCIANLKKAVALFKTTNTNTKALENDIMFKGDNNSWIKFANTLKLKMLLRMSEMADMQQYINTELSGMSVANDFLTVAATVNPGYTNSKPYPLYAYAGYNSDGSTANEAATYYCESAFMHNLYAKLSDPRAQKVFKTATATGHNFGNGYKQFGSPNLIGASSSYNNLWLDTALLEKNKQRAANIIILAETKFLLAEAIVRGYLTGNAKTTYEAGVDASLNLLGLPSYEITKYKSQGTIAANRWINYDSTANKIEIIIYQKYIALCCINGFEAWCEYRRTGFPATTYADDADGNFQMLSINPGATRREIPSVLLYPQTEYNLNTDNVMAAVRKMYHGNDLDGNYQFDAKVFWDVK